ncbi:hypothetical protein SBA1_580002 [Candidatus Sulfotelmatobacter kueseliae]|uniref:Uncharacterized protein n=1 Tax=Candidatus Sulfotelmatobacter kueseliae TaxID=2042962 RepID=A0A2U3L065_9BACT|nr:hypothetical protein SBA1_580002 [Candidatus Sulfotelmatobacter kueseliae]
MFSSQPPRSAFLHPSAYRNHGDGVSNFYRFEPAFDSQDCHDQMLVNSVPPGSQSP